MPSPIVVADLLASAARLAGVLADGETLTPSEFTDCLLVLNDMLENWSTEKLSVWGAQDQTFNLTPGTGSYTIGLGGTFNTQRPAQGIVGAYCTMGGVDFPVRVVGQREWNELSLKSLSGGPVEKLLYVGSYPLGNIGVWPVPSAAMSVTLTMARSLTFPVALADTLTGPPGFMKALRACVGVEICPEFGTQASPELVALATDAKADFKRVNQLTPPVLGVDAALLGGGVADWRAGF